MSLVAWVGSALAAPTLFSAPPPTLEKGVVTGGGAVGFTNPGLPALGGWGRTGVGKRVEGYGGAWMTFLPVQLGIYGGLRASVGNPGGSDGFGASAGLEIADNLIFATTSLSLSAPLRAGWQTRGVHVWLGVTPEVNPVGLFDVSGQIGVDFPVDVYTLGVLGSYSLAGVPVSGFTFSYRI